VATPSIPDAAPNRERERRLMSDLQAIADRVENDALHGELGRTTRHRTVAPGDALTFAGAPGADEPGRWFRSTTRRVP
jgi:hypothetical protein